MAIGLSTHFIEMVRGISWPIDGAGEVLPPEPAFADGISRAGPGIYPRVQSR
jgi:hypothetical protein